jgi:hypothetical protein
MFFLSNSESGTGPPHYIVSGGGAASSHRPESLFFIFNSNFLPKHLFLVF